MQIAPFQMERWQSTHEHSVEINLSDSGVHPLTMRELLDDGDELVRAADERLIYTQTNGSEALREAVAALYPGATRDAVQVVNGGAEANLIATWDLVDPGDEVVVLLPNYMQIFGLAESLGAVMRPWHMVPDLERGRWSVDLAALEALVTQRTKLIVICNPNNPTGTRLGEETLDGIARVAERVGAWVLADEIYQGSELHGDETPTLWGHYDRAIVTNSLSKAYGLPGLRLGWIVAPPQLIERFWTRHDYTTIGPGTLSDFLAVRAFEPGRRARLLERTHRLLTRNYAVVADWLSAQGSRLRFVPPDAGAMLYLKYDHAIGSSELAERLRAEKSVLIVPGDHFGMDHWLRIGFGGETEHVVEGLARVRALLDEIG
ncbi:MAG: aminotransferase class I/II-fold pyridoxal phosphate-dependent enzyme [bacterium]|nr:aminotransferase class I/II-fold pyridoxal phosphate-dependent enzyme [bacterium]